MYFHYHVDQGGAEGHPPSGDRQAGAGLQADDRGQDGGHDDQAVRRRDPVPVT